MLDRSILVYQLNYWLSFIEQVTIETNTDSSYTYVIILKDNEAIK